MSVMRRIKWLALGLVVLSAVAAAPPAVDSRAYQTLGEIAVQNHGRRKPLDTLAREAVKEIHGYSSVKQYNDKDELIAMWPAVAAVFDWEARPGYWNDQEIILVRYLPLKQLLLNEAARDRLAAVASQKATPAAARAVLEELAKAEEISVGDLSRAANLEGIAKVDKESLTRIAKKLSVGQWWLSANDIEDAVVVVDGKKQPFADWFSTILARNRAVRFKQMGERLKNAAPVGRLSTLEEKTMEVGERLARYKAFRDNNGRAMEGFELELVPRPASSTYIGFVRTALLKDPKRVAEIFPRKNLDQSTVDTLMKAIDGKGVTPSAFEEDALVDYDKFIDEVKNKERFFPGVSKETDARFITWLREKAAWVPLRLLLDNDSKELERAGYDLAQVEACRSAFREVEAAEQSSPGHISPEKAATLLAAVRKLGSSSNDSYPSASILALETRYNRHAPFYWAPVPYGCALLLLLISIGITAERHSVAGTFGRVLYVLGLSSLVLGIVFEIYGFSLRVRISGWAPVTNMYETVIWVALITAVLGFVLELIYRKGFAALAAAGVSLLTTVLAANVSQQILDPNIKNLTPVLRSNYWLTIHVLTIVSSYAAFALTMGLGLLATGYYLTATYRRSARFSELAMPLIPGLLLLIPGAFGVYFSYFGLGASWLSSNAAYYVVSAVAGLGGILTIMATFALIGEAANRSPAQMVVVGLASLLCGLVGSGASVAGVGSELLFGGSLSLAGLGAAFAVLGLFGSTTRVPAGSEAKLEQAETAGDAEALSSPASTAWQGSEESGGGVATLTKPTVADIRARLAASRPQLDERALAMQATAARIKPIANFLYRAMQVGVLLVAVGTFLGGWWADESWGRFWGWDPKEVWALITLLVYLVPLHGRFAGWVNTFGLVVASVVCFGSVLMAWYGVNFVLGVGLHSYGFSEGGGQGVVLSATAAVLAVVAAAAWRRSNCQYRAA
jgi:ABC-type transport system involved in cytochrome c biogenesis permease subunit